MEVEKFLEHPAEAPLSISERIPGRNTLDVVPHPPRTRILRGFLILAVVALGMGLVGGGIGYWVHTNEAIMNTQEAQVGPYHVRVVVNQEESLPLIQQSFVAMDDVYQLLDRQGTQSDVAKVNRVAGVTGLLIDPLVFRLAKEGARFASFFTGAYNPLLGNVMDLWRSRLGDPKGEIPTREELDRALSSTDISGLLFGTDADTVGVRDPAARLDFQSVLPAVMVKRGIATLVAQGVQSAWVQVGDVVGVLGLRKDGEPWQVGVPDPDDPRRILGMVQLASGQSVVTVGQYQEAYEQGGKHYHLLLDPRDGYPANRARSMTVVANDPLTAAFLAQGGFVLGPRKGGHRIADVPGAQSLSVAANGKIITSAGLSFQLSVSSQ